MKFGNRYWLNEESVRELVDGRHLTHIEFAALLGVSRTYWSQIVNGRRALTPKVRRALLTVLPGDEGRLWSGRGRREAWDLAHRLVACTQRPPGRLASGSTGACGGVPG